jgi:hypothetical protein
MSKLVESWNANPRDHSSTSHSGREKGRVRDTLLKDWRNNMLAAKRDSEFHSYEVSHRLAAMLCQTMEPGSKKSLPKGFNFMQDDVPDWWEDFRGKVANSPEPQRSGILGEKERPYSGWLRSGLGRRSNDENRSTSTPTLTQNVSRTPLETIRSRIRVGRDLWHTAVQCLCENKGYTYMSATGAEVRVQPFLSLTFQ